MTDTRRAGGLPSTVPLPSLHHRAQGRGDIPAASATRRSWRLRGRHRPLPARRAGSPGDTPTRSCFQPGSQLLGGNAEKTAQTAHQNENTKPGLTPHTEVSHGSEQNRQNYRGGEELALQGTLFPCKEQVSTEIRVIQLTRLYWIPKWHVAMLLSA